MTLIPHATKYLPCLRVYAPDWYARSDWMAYLNRERDCTPATWHPSGESPDAFSDVFIVYDAGDGPDCHAIPDDIWKEIDAIALSASVDYAVFWVTNRN